MTDNRPPDRPAPSRLRTGVALAGFLLLAGYFLWTEHRAHVFLALPYLPWLLLLACPLMHFFMHGGHGRHGRGGGRSGPTGDGGQDE
jgi:hypothetical protein